MRKTCEEVCILSCLCIAVMFRPVFLQADLPAENDTSTLQKKWESFECSRGCRSSIEALRATVNDLSSAVEINARETKIAQEKILHLENQFASSQQQLRAALEQYASNLSDYQNGVATKFSSIEARLRTSSLQVGFTVKFSSNPVTNVVANGIYKFNQIVTNVGNAYSVYTGMFTAPVSGLYALHFNFMSTNDTPGVQVVLQKEELVVGYAWANGREGIHDQGLATALVFMQQGQRAWVQHSWGSTVIRGGAYTFFSGFLVQAQ